MVEKAKPGRLSSLTSFLAVVSDKLLKETKVQSTCLEKKSTCLEKNSLFLVTDVEDCPTATEVDILLKE